MRATRLILALVMSAACGGARGLVLHPKDAGPEGGATAGGDSAAGGDTMSGLGGAAGTAGPSDSGKDGVAGAVGGDATGASGGNASDGPPQGGSGGTIQGGSGGASTEGGSGGSGQGGSAGGSGGTDSSPIYRSPYAVAYASDSAVLAVSDTTAGELVLLAPKAGTAAKTVKLAGKPKGLAWSGSGKVMVAEYDAGTVAEVDATAAVVRRRIDVGGKPTDVALSADGAKLVVPDFGLNQVLVLDVATGKPLSSVPVAPYPFAVAVSPVGDTAVVTHLLASGDATRPDAASSVTLVDIAGGKVSASIKLPPGSTAIRGVRCSADGKWAYVVHTLARLNVPTTQLPRGWTSTNALTIIDLSGKSVYATTLLDRISEGAADPWGVDVSPDGKTLWVSAAGAHQVLRVNLGMLHKLLAGPIPSELARPDGGVPTTSNRNKDGYNVPLSDVWFEIAADPSKRSLLADDLGALYSAGLLQVIRLAPAQGPRGISISPDGKQLAVAMYFAGQVGLVDATSNKVEKFIDVGVQPDETWSRQGERIFHDASRSLQGWLSCSTCHPDGRSDGLGRDMMNDGGGNPRNSHSMLYSPNLPPVASHGAGATTAVAITARFKDTAFTIPERSWETAVGAYVNALAAESYGKPGAARSEAARRGEAVFAKAACGDCHAGRYYADLKAHDVGTKGARDRASDGAEYYTPPLAELWRSAPYLHDGSAATLKEVLTTKNTGDKHGKTSALTAQEVDDLVQFLLEIDPPAPETVDVFPAAAPSPPKAVFRGQNPAAPIPTMSGIDLTDPTLAAIDKILFIKRDYLPTNDNAKGAAICDQYHGFNAPKNGGLFILEDVLSGAPSERNVLTSSTCANGPHQGKKLEGGGFLSPDLSFDGKQILFAYTDVGQFQTWDESSTFHIFKVNTDGSGLTQLTQGSHNDFDPTWLPDGRIAFISDRRQGFTRRNPRPVPIYTLFVMNADGSGIEPLSYHESNEWHPSVDHSGLLLYTRWDWMDRGSNQVHHPWVTTADGLDARAILGNYGNRATVTPRAILNIREIPGTSKLIGTAAPHHQQAYGSIVMMDPDIEDDDGMAPYTVITKDTGFPQVGNDPSSNQNYATAWPIDEHRFLVVHDPNSTAHGLTGKRFGIYLIDDQGNKQLLYKDPSHSCLDPIPLAPRTVPRVLPTTRTAKPTEMTEVNVLNVYDSMLPMPAGVEIKALRVVQVFPKSTPLTINPRLGHGAILYNDQSGRGSLGIVPVEKDGSAHFLLPPGKLVYFQALDANGTAVQSMRSSTYAVPSTARITCQGCHERRYRAPKARADIPIAFGRAASTLLPEADGSYPLSFARLIQPILDRSCVSCHGTAKPGDLSKGDYPSDADRFYASYRNLKPYLSYYDFDYVFGPTVTTPGKLGARTSALYPMLRDGHQGVDIADADLRRIALWLDLNSDMFSDDLQRDAQAKGDAVTPSLE